MVGWAEMWSGTKFLAQCPPHRRDIIGIKVLPQGMKRSSPVSGTPGSGDLHNEDKPPMSWFENQLSLTPGELESCKKPNHTESHIINTQVICEEI